MTSFLLASALSAAITFSTTIENAGPQTLPSAPAMSSADREAVVTLAKFSRCVVNREPKATTAFLNRGQYAVPSNPEVRTLVGRNKFCLRGGRMEFNQVIFAGNAAEVLYRQAGFSFANHRSILTGAEPLERGSCVAARHPREVDLLFSTPPASKEEAAALNAMMDTIEACMPTVLKSAVMRRAVIAADVFPLVATYLKAPH